MLQICKHILLLALYEVVGLAIIHRRVRQLDVTVTNLNRRAQQVDEHRWN